MKNKKKVIRIGLGAISLLAVGTLLLAGVSAPMQVETLVVEPGDAVITYAAQGEVIYHHTLEVTAPMSGEILEIPVREGEAVKKGQTIAVLSATDVEYQIRRLETDIKGYQAQIYNLNLSEQKERDILLGSRDELQGQLTTLHSQIRAEENAESTREARLRLQESIVDQDRANVRIARQELKNYRDDYGSDTGDGEYNGLKAGVNNAEKSLYTSEQALLELQDSSVEEGYYEGMQESLQAQIDSINSRLGNHYGAGLQSYYAALIESAQLSIAELEEQQGRATVTAPRDGVVSALPIREAAMVEPGSLIASLGAEPTVEILVPVRELDGVNVGDAVTLTVNKRTGDETTAGTVLEIAGQAVVQLSPLGVEESKIRVLVRPGDSIPVGYQADVEFTVYRQEQCLTVPPKALFELDGQDSVWVIRDGVALVQPVVKGVETRSGAIIDEGLLPGDVVISDANTRGLAPGKKVAQAV